MLAIGGVWREKREALKARRSSLFQSYMKNAHDMRTALEIKTIDDEIAECTQHMEQEWRIRRSASGGATG